jgi:hypothetical protein
LARNLGIMLSIKLAVILTRHLGHDRVLVNINNAEDFELLPQSPLALILAVKDMVTKWPKGDQNICHHSQVTISQQIGYKPTINPNVQTTRMGFQCFKLKKLWSYKQPNRWQTLFLTYQSQNSVRYSSQSGRYRHPSVPLDVGVSALESDPIIYRTATAISDVKL